MSRRLADDDVMRLLAAANPVTPRPAQTEALDDLYAEALLVRITAAPPTEQPAARRRRRLWTRLTAVLAAIAAALAAVFAMAAPATAGDVLRETATAAAEVPLGDGQYWYVNAKVEYPGQPVFAFESWHSNTAYLQRSERAATLDAAENHRDHLDPNLIRVLEIRDEDGRTPGFGSELQLTRSQLAMLPADPDGLRHTLLQHIDHAPHGDDFAVWQAAVGLLWSAPLSPAQRQAAWEVLATSPSITLLGPQTDTAGRPAQAIEADWSARRLGRQTILVDVDNGTLLEVLDHENDGVTLLHRTTIIEAGTRAQAPKAQPPLCGPESVPARPC